MGTSESLPSALTPGARESPMLSSSGGRGCEHGIKARKTPDRHNLRRPMGLSQAVGLATVWEEEQAQSADLPPHRAYPHLAATPK